MEPITTTALLSVTVKGISIGFYKYLSWAVGIYGIVKGWVMAFNWVYGMITVVL